jgi:uncharacterized glyoxalase superfamily protein PhnB
MKNTPTRTELARPFLPAKNFDLSKRFYLAIVRIGSSSFILQRHYNKQWAENFMMQLMVDDLDLWWEHITGLDLVRNYSVSAPRAPAQQPWGLRVAYLVDPSGVLWHVAERREGVIHDS